ncbi:hypothetical protein EJ02DRAFT_510921 [Clathrospora elynae]|uniref:Uncharacterized protein n=1 Tax=Clathrospora elynae TaxID=706981 RepID=A0A6A5SVQ6_9PLEO|nr:hypothetical protein EJ02DRAFT_510921 [Clathrospora elynae]
MSSKRTSNFKNALHRMSCMSSTSSHYSDFPSFDKSSVYPTQTLSTNHLQLPRDPKAVVKAAHKDSPGLLPAPTADCEEVRYFLYAVLTTKSFGLTKTCPQWVLETCWNWEGNGNDLLCMDERGFMLLCPFSAGAAGIDGKRWKVETLPRPEAREMIGKAIMSVMEDKRRTLGAQKKRMQREWDTERSQKLSHSRSAIGLPVCYLPSTLPMSSPLGQIGTYQSAPQYHAPALSSLDSSSMRGGPISYGRLSSLSSRHTVSTMKTSPPTSEDASVHKRDSIVPGEQLGLRPAKPTSILSLDSGVLPQTRNEASHLVRQRMNARMEALSSAPCHNFQLSGHIPVGNGVDEQGHTDQISRVSFSPWDDQDQGHNNVSQARHNSMNGYHSKGYQHVNMRQQNSSSYMPVLPTSSSMPRVQNHAYPNSQATNSNIVNMALIPPKQQRPHMPGSQVGGPKWTSEGPHRISFSTGPAPQHSASTYPPRTSPPHSVRTESTHRSDRSLTPATKLAIRDTYLSGMAGHTQRTASLTSDSTPSSFPSTRPLNNARGDAHALEQAQYTLHQAENARTQSMFELHGRGSAAEARRMSRGVSRSWGGRYRGRGGGGGGGALAADGDRERRITLIEAIKRKEMFDWRPQGGVRPEHYGAEWRR